MATQELIPIPAEIAAQWRKTGFSLASLMDICGGEDEFYDALLSGRIPKDWEMKARAAMDPQALQQIRLARIESKLDTLISMWLGEEAKS